MTLSPRGASAVVHGSPGKGWMIMLVGGVMAWISGQSWSTGRGFGEVFSLLMAYGTLAALAVPATLVAGRSSKPWLIGLAGLMGMTIPWFFDLAVEFGGEGIWLTSLVILVTSWTVTFVVSWGTRWVARYADQHHL
ncbi:hypothetical protein [Ornithinimicrobium pekingense]|uniref:DUF3147 family protein n=1 Tax=Ornithinimicrobium pekingense TaxID=384677 RepID=A0ABQ2FC08_9MICO|nr:hypothetical protein [Ornithinimicrobium pekingense]GGK78753.1 hypothetical protein GCM10011509_29110 [Ornithinimicrobium pekingense]